MLRLGIVGTSIHSAPLSLLSNLTIPREDRGETLRELAAECGFSELVYISTCNRVEFVFQQTEERPLRTARNRILDFFFKNHQDVSFQPENFYLAGGIEAARHLFTVASALDSLVIGEAQILGQVKESFCEAKSAGLVCDELPRVFQAAFRCAKKVRRETDIGARRVSIVNLALESLQQHVAASAGCGVAIVGTGPMTPKLAEAFRGFGVRRLYFVNRTRAKAEELASKWQGEALSLDEFRSSPPCVDVVCTATAAPTAIFTQEDTERLLAVGDINRPFLYLDLAIPRDVSDDVAQIANVRVCHLGTLRDLAQENRRDRFRAADRARELVDLEVGRYHKQVVETTLSPIFSQAHGRARDFANTGLESLFDSRLKGLDETEREALRYWVINKLVPNVLHMPMKAISESSGPSQWHNEESREDVAPSGGVMVHGFRLAPPKC